MKKRKVINVDGAEIVLFSRENKDYISLTDIAKYRDKNHADMIITNWIRNYATIEFLGTWERLNNPSFKPFEFEGFKNESGSNGFVMTPKKWINGVNAIGIFSKAGRYGGGTFAHKYIALNFANWISTEFYFYFVAEFDRLKQAEQEQKSLEWDLQRMISKINYHIHTDAIKEHIIPQVVNDKQKTFVYANEADLLNVALFGKTAAEWRVGNPDNKGNIRDEATLEQLVVLSNLESINALLIKNSLSQAERLT
jgi:phage regulator Rha-like protein